MKHEPDCPFADQGAEKSCWCVTEEPGGIRFASPEEMIQLTVPGSTKVTIRGAVVLRHRGHEVRMDATYDFADVPPELHCLLLNLIMQQRQVHSYL